MSFYFYQFIQFIFLTDLTYIQVHRRLQADDDKMPHYSTTSRIIKRLRKDLLLPTLKDMKNCTLLHIYIYIYIYFFYIYILYNGQVNM